MASIVVFHMMKFHMVKSAWANNVGLAWGLPDYVKKWCTLIGIPIWLHALAPSGTTLSFPIRRQDSIAFHYRLTWTIAPPKPIGFYYRLPLTIGNALLIANYYWVCKELYINPLGFY
jgi:hypothetical protein